MAKEKGKEKSKGKEKEVKNKKSFFKDFKAELKKVIWPTPKQLVNNTMAVVVIVVLTAAIVFVLDLAFDLFNKYGINNLKSKIKGSETVQIQNEVGNTIENIVDENVVIENGTEESNSIENE